MIEVIIISVVLIILIFLTVFFISVYNKLVLLRNDLNNNWIEIRALITKRYELATKLISGNEDNEYIQKLEKGVDIGDEKRTKPANVQRISDNEMELTITEGRFHQVKRMFHANRHEVFSLKRLRIGGVFLDPSLAPGEYRLLTAYER